MPQPFISICIPAYKRTLYLTRLLNSIEVQSYKNFEVVVTDDSDDEQVADLCKTFASSFTLHYYKNPLQLGAAANWNQCLGLGSSEWLKIMHDDDWFATNDSLAKFAEATKKDIKFIWSNYFARNENTQKVFTKNESEAKVLDSIKNPFLLFGDNVVGPPTTVLIHKSVPVKYDVSMVWLVDIDYFINALLHEHEGYYIHEPLVYFSYNDSQVTNLHFNNKSTEIHEAMILWHKHGAKMISGTADYSAWWRLVRNLKINSLQDFNLYAQGLDAPDFIADIISFQKNIPRPILKNPVFSKVFMLFCYYLKYSKSLR